MGRPLLGLGSSAKTCQSRRGDFTIPRRDQLARKRATEIEKQLARGHAVVELDPGVIDASFVVDRLGTNTEGSGYPRGADPGTWSTSANSGAPAPGRRRSLPGCLWTSAVGRGQRIGGTIKAVVRDLSDEQLVVSQGQENNSRTDLNFIERSFFAAAGEQGLFPRRYYGVAGRRQGSPVAHDRLGQRHCTRNYRSDRSCTLIWPTALGRTRCHAGRQRQQGKGSRHITEPQFGELKSDERFQDLYDILRAKKEKPSVISWTPANGQQLVRITDTDDQVDAGLRQARRSRFCGICPSALGGAVQRISQQKS